MVKLLLLAILGGAIGFCLVWVPFPWNLCLPFFIGLMVLAVVSPLAVVGGLLGISATRLLWRAGGISPDELLYSFTFLGLLGISLLRQFLRPQGDLRSGWETPVAFPLFCMGLVGIWGSILGILHGHLFVHWTSDLNFILFFWLYFVVVASARETRDLYRVIWPTLWITAGVAVWGAVLRIRSGGLFTGLFPGFPRGMAFSSTFFILTVCLTLFSEPGSGRKRGLFFLSLFFGLHQFLSFVRVAWISQLASAGFIVSVLPFSARGRFMRGIGVGLSILSLVFIASWIAPTDNLAVKTPTYLTNRFLSIFTDVVGEGVTMHTRYSEWGAALQQFLQHPFLGNGLGTQIQFVRYDFANFPLTTERYIHSSFIYYLLNTGPLGLAVFLWFCVCMIRYGLQVYRRLESGPVKGLALGMTASLVYQVFSSLAGNELNNPSRTIWTGFFVGALAVIDRQSKEAKQR